MNSISPVKLNGNPVIGFFDKILTNHGEFHFEKVSDTFYRGSDATAKEFPLLVKEGIEKVVNLKTLSAKEVKNLEKAVQENGMEFRNIPYDPLRPWKYVLEIAKEIKDPKTKYFHCTFGVDRTGNATGIEKLIEGIPMHKVMADMKKHGYNLAHRIVFFPMEVALRIFAKKNLPIK